MEIDIWDFIGIWCLGYEISKILNTRDIITKDSPSIAYSTVKFHARCQQPKLIPHVGVALEMDLQILYGTET